MNCKFVFLVLKALHLQSNFKCNTMSFFKENSKFYNEKSIVTASKIVAWKINNNSYNFKKLPKSVILAPNSNITKGLKRYKYKKIKGLLGNNYLLNKDFLLSFNFGIGSSAVITHIEELRVLGVRNIIFIGFAGIFSNNIKEGNAYLVSKAYAISGASFYYLNNEEFVANNKLSNTFNKKINLKNVISVSIDTPYRETKTLLDIYANKGASLIDMESAAVIAISQFYNLDCACILIGSDNVENTEWTPPKNLSKLISKVDEIIKKIVFI